MWSWSPSHAWPLAHVPEKWEPVFRKGHAPINESRAHPDSTQSGCALELIERAAGDQPDEVVFGNLAARGLGLLVVARIFHHQHRLALGGEHLQAPDALADGVGAVALAVAVLAVEQVFTRERVDRPAEL